MEFYYGDGSIVESPNLNVISSLVALRDSGPILANFNFVSYLFNSNLNKIEAIAIIDPPIFLNPSTILLRVRDSILFSNFDLFFANIEKVVRERFKSINEVLILPSDLSEDKYIDFWFHRINILIERNLKEFLPKNYISELVNLQKFIESNSHISFNWKHIRDIYDGKSKDQYLSSEFLFNILEHYSKNFDIEFTRDWGEISIKFSRSRTGKININKFIPVEPIEVFSIDGGILVVGSDEDLDILTDSLSALEHLLFRGRVVDAKNRLIYGKNNKPLKPRIKNGIEEFTIDGRKYTFEEILNNLS